MPAFPINTKERFMTTKLVNLALQGGGAHGAFAWGVLDKLIEDGRVAIDGLSATSAGAMNAAAYAYGKMTGGPDGARAALHNFWEKVSKTCEVYSPLKQMPWESLWSQWNGGHSLSFLAFEAWTRLLSPYQFNPFNINPLRDVIDSCVDFEQLARCRCTRLFISATNVRTGRARVFTNEEVTLDVVLASACLPFLFQAVEIEGSAYWDGGYMGNPVLFPLFYHTDSRDIVIIHLNPIFVHEVPKTAAEISDRVNEISFNSSLLKELRSIAFVTKLLEEDWIKDEHRAKLRHMLVHSIRADEALGDFGVASKFNCDWHFLTELRDRGRATAEQWLAEHYIHLGKRGTVDLREEFLGGSSQHADAYPARGGSDHAASA
jgi:NTE family protein